MPFLWPSKPVAMLERIVNEVKRQCRDPNKLNYCEPLHANLKVNFNEPDLDDGITGLSKFEIGALYFIDQDWDIKRCNKKLSRNDNLHRDNLI